MRILFGDPSTGAINFFLKFKMAAIRYNLGSNCYQNFLTVRDTAKRSKFPTLSGLLHTKLQLLKIPILGHMTPQGHLTSEM